MNRKHQLCSLEENGKAMHSRSPATAKESSPFASIAPPACQTEESSIDLLPLLASQTQLWVGQQLDPGSRAFNVGGYVTIKGPLDVACFQAAAAACIAETESLRLRFLLRNDRPGQLVCPKSSVSLAFLDISAKADPLSFAMGLMQTKLHEPMDLFAGKTFSWTLMKLSPSHFIWCGIYHHIAIDGLSTILIVRRVRQLYQAIRHGVDAKPACTATLSGLADSEVAYRSSTKFLEDQSYWRRHLQSTPPPVSLSKVKTHSGSWRPRSQSICLPAPLVEQFIAAAEQLKTTLPRLLTGMITIAVQKMSGSSDFLLGLVVTGRTGRFRNISANVTHVLPLRFHLTEDSSISDAIQAAAAAMDGANAHKLYQMEDMRRDLGLRPNDPHLFGIELNIMPFLFSEAEDGLRWTSRCLSIGPVADLNISICNREEDGQLKIDFNGNEDRFIHDELVQLSEEFERLMRDLAAKPPNAKIRELAVLNERKQHLPLPIFNQTNSGLMPTRLPDLFEAQVARSPNAFALDFNGVRLTYDELDAAANRTARYLLARGVGPEQVVALLLPRSPELVVTMLGVIKAGAAYLPLDIDHPVERISYMIRDSDARLVVSTQSTSSSISLPAGIPVMVTDNEAVQRELKGMPARALSDEERLEALTPYNLLYVIYTSGSTGAPKGVAIEHRSFTVFLQAILSQVRFGSDDTLLAITTISFDIAGLEIFLPLIRGGCIAMLDGAMSRDPYAVANAVRSMRATVVQATPTFWRALVEFDLPREIRALVGGEALSADLAARLLEFREAINLYGPTETTVWSSAHRLEPQDVTIGPVVTIGKPLREQKFFILDEQLKTVPSGATGELFIAGAGLARGYLRRPELTRERFISCPFGEPGDLMYKTGDLARLRADGNVEFLGRSDHQIKIRGFRIEPGEIENAIMRTGQGISNCAVVPREVRGQTRLIAYYTAIPGRPLLADRDIRLLLAGTLPDYMLPFAFVHVELMPVTGNGKIDRRALPQFKLSDDSETSPAPANALEKVIAQVFAEFTGATTVSREDDFFALGGNSLAAVLCVHRLRRVLEQEVTLRQLFDSPTPKDLAIKLAQKVPAQPDGMVETSSSLPLIFLLPGVGGDEPRLMRFREECRVSARMITLDYPDWTELNDSRNGLSLVVDHLIRQIELHAPEDAPIRLMGYSYGGYCAHALTLRLLELGRDVDFIGLLDTSLLAADKSILSVQLQEGLSLSNAFLFGLQDIGRVLRSVRTRQLPRTLALVITRWLNMPSARRVLSWAARRRHVRLPLVFGYYLHHFLDESRRVAAVKHWYGKTGRDEVLPTAQVYLFRSQEDLPGHLEDLGWKRYFRSVKILYVSGMHETMFDPPHLENICRQARRAIETLTSPGTQQDIVNTPNPA